MTLDRFRSRIFRAATLAAAAATTLVPVPGTGDERPAAFDRASLGSSDPAVSMQSETLPARVARVRVVPGSGGAEAWALGFSTAGLPRWGRDGRTQQVVFLRYRPDTGWALVGPPERAHGSPFNPVLAAFDLAANGEGWAVGEAGLLLHKKPGSDRWVQDDRLSAEETLTSVSLRMEGGAVVGYAVGTRGAVYRLAAGAWHREPNSADIVADGSPELAAVATVTGEDAWAVTGSATERLVVYRRENGVWQRKATGRDMFDRPPAKSDYGGGVVQSASGSAIAADATGAWVGGQMFPSSLAHPTGDTEPGAASRPFMVRFHSGGGVTTYCPDQYATRQGGSASALDISRVCERPFPSSLFDITSISLVPGAAFAGGFGLYRFDGKGWYREPDTNGYLISVSMASASEGWVASTGSSFGAGGTIRSTATTVGHWTAKPRVPSVARWPHAQHQLLEGVAVAADGSGRAVAVGQRTAAVVYQPGAGWEVTNPESFDAFHAAAWPAGDDPWIVGQGGLIYRLRQERDLARDPASSLTDLSLYGVAFASREDGVAVGAGGTILRFSGDRWRVDPQSQKITTSDLYAVVAVGQGYVAAGRDGTVLERSAGAWKIRSDARAALVRGDRPVPALYALTVLPDGRVLAGGADSALIASAPDGTFSAFEPPLEGTVAALAASGTAAAPRLFASVSPDLIKYRGDRPSLVRGTMMVGDGKTWRDASLGRRTTMFTTTDSSAFEDPIYALAPAGAQSAWGVGGTPANTRSDEGHFRSEPTGSVYRADLAADPSPPDVRATPAFSATGITFAVFGESWCGRGFCSATAGSGTMADEVALRIRDEINDASKLPDGPRFVLFTGNMRRQGLPEELAQFQGFLRGFRIPVFAALGSTDLVPGSTDPVTGAVDSTGLAARATNDVWQQVFGSQPQPWGEAPPRPGLRPVPHSVAPLAGLARTHYAFDVMDGSKERMRVVVLDSSTRSYGNPAEQNPRNESQDQWLSQVLAEAQIQLGVPRIVVMNQPTFVPTASAQPLNWNKPDNQAHFEATVLTARVSAILTGGMRMNAASSVPRDSGQIPLFVMGGGGAPLGFETAVEEASKEPGDGFYHGWHAVTVEVDRADQLGQAPVSVQTFPVLESVAIRSLHGRVLRAGYSAELVALARGLPGGWSDAEQAKAQHMVLGSRAPRKCHRQGQGFGSCRAQTAIEVPVRFFSRTPEIADFVVPDPAGNRVGSPKRDPVTNKVIRDASGKLGVLCSFKTGVAQISAQVGYHEARIALLVRGGDGPCVDAPVPDPPDPPVPVVDPPPVEEPVEEPRAIDFRPVQRVSSLAIFPPPPAPAVAPAPPAAPGVGRKEEQEFSPEHEGHGQDHHATALVPGAAAESRARRSVALAASRRGEVLPAPLMLGAIALFSFAGASAAALARRRLARTSPARQRGGGT